MVFIYLELLISKEGRLWLYKKRCAVGLISYFSRLWNQGKHVLSQCKMGRKRPFKSEGISPSKKENLRK